MSTHGGQGCLTCRWQERSLIVGLGVMGSGVFHVVREGKGGDVSVIEYNTYIKGLLDEY